MGKTFILINPMMGPTTSIFDLLKTWREELVKDFHYSVLGQTFESDWVIPDGLRETDEKPAAKKQGGRSQDTNRERGGLETQGEQARRG